MKVIIAGSRDITSYLEVFDACLKSNYEITEIVSGGARGVDKLGEAYAKEHWIDLTVFHANWDAYGKRAGILRNKRMGDYAEALIAVWDGTSSGTKQMIDYMKSKNKSVYIHLVSNAQ